MHELIKVACIIKILSGIDVNDLNPRHLAFNKSNYLHLTRMNAYKEIKKVTTHVVQEMKQRGEKISMLTAYDYSMAKIFDAAKVDILLVGDSASNVMHGYETTVPITLD